MKVGIDLSPLQGPHRMRGIGYTLLNLINNLPLRDRKDNQFVFYILPEHLADFADPLSLLDLTSMKYEVRPLMPERRINTKLPGRLNLFISSVNAALELLELYKGSRKRFNTNGLDVFLQTDQGKSFPHNRRLRKVLVIYDIIPYVLEWDYLWSYKTARKVKGYSRKAALRCHARRWLYIKKLGINLKKANMLLAISQTTKRDFLRVFNLGSKEIRVTPLGVPPINNSANRASELVEYKKTSWGYLPFYHHFANDEKYILFVGGVDRRRKLEDVIQALNHLWARGETIKLVLAGDSMRGPEAISTEEIQGALKRSSYLTNVIFMGFIDDATRDWLYKHALAFVFPSRYEGFGLPVLEAMSYGCPVISYRNEATVEVAGDAPLYVDDANEIADAIGQIIYDDGLVSSMRTAGLKQVKSFTWQKTAQEIFKVMR